MSDLDERLRRAIHASAEQLVETPPLVLPERQPGQGTVQFSRRRVSKRRNRVAGVAAAALLLATTSVALSLARDESSRRLLTIEESTPSSDEWRVLVPDGIESESSISMVTTPEGIIVIAGGAMHRIDPGSGEVERLADPILTNADIVWADDRLVAVSTELVPAQSAWWLPAEDRWVDLGELPADLLLAGWPLPYSQHGLNLVWTGERVVDVTHGAVLDTGTAEWSVLAAPPASTNHVSLSGHRTAVWDGREIVLAPFAPVAGVAWSATGASARPLPPIPAELVDDPNVVHDSVAASSRGRVVMVSGSESGRAVAFDGSTDTWAAMPNMPGMSSTEGCPSYIAVAATSVIVQPCEFDQPYRFDGDRWVPLPDPPFVSRCCSTVWSGSSDKLVIWGTDSGTSADAAAPTSRIAIWVPPEPPDADD